MNIYVGNLPKSTNDEIVRKLFEAHGEVTDVKLIKDHDTGELRGFGFIEMPSKTDAQKAIQELNDTELEGRTIIVNEARRRNDRSSNRRQRGGGGGGGFRGGPRSRSW